MGQMSSHHLQRCHPSHETFPLYNQIVMYYTRHFSKSQAPSTFSIRNLGQNRYILLKALLNKFQNIISWSPSFYFISKLFSKS